MKVLVTGSNGHIGNHVVRELHRRGHDVVAMVREGADLTGHAGLALEHRIGDVRDAKAVRAAADGCEAIVHLAAVYELGARDPDRIVRPAVEGTENVLRAAKETGARVVHCSSTYAVGFSTTAVARDESSWNERLDDPYAAAKTLSEKRAWELARELGLDLVAVLPTGVLGPHDYRRTPSHELLVGTVMFPASRYSGGLTYTDVRDAAHVLCAAMERGTPGERYLVTSENVTTTEYLAHVSARCGTPVLPSPWPRAMVVPAWKAAEWVVGAFGGKMPLPGAAIDEFYGRWVWFDCTKAQRAFGWTPIPLRDQLDLALQWCASRGWITGARAARLRETLGPPPAWD